MEVDLVYTWVNGADEDYLKICQKYSEKPIDLNPERYRDTYQMLRYSLRSVEKYLDWYRNIYIVTARPQRPNWLVIPHPRIKIVHHDEIIDPEYLPTFNPNCIESYLHKIPGLSEHFIYINDDFLFGRDTKIDDFFQNGRHTIFNTFFGENLSWRIYDGKNDIVGLGLIEHTPLFIKKNFWEEMVGLFPEKMQQTRNHKFRKPEDLMTYKLYRYHMLKNHRQVSNPIPIHKLLKVNTFHKITNDLKFQQKVIAQLERKRPKFYCLNDDQKNNPNQEVIILLYDFLDKNYSSKATWEL